MWNKKILFRIWYFQKIKKGTSRYIPIAHWSYKAYSLFHFETGTTTTVFNLPDNLHG